MGEGRGNGGLCTLVAGALLAEIDAGRLTIDAWEVDGPTWRQEMSGRVTYLSLQRPSGTEIRLRHIAGKTHDQGFAPKEMLVVRDGVVVAEALSGAAERLIDRVMEQLGERRAELSREVEREFI
jgi:hypothetical protein